MPEKKSTGKSASGSPFRVRWSLSTTVVLALIALISIPVSAMGFATYFRSRALMQEQASNQLKSIIDTQSREIDKLAVASKAYLNELVEDTIIQNAIENLINAGDDANPYLTAFQLNNFRNRNPLFEATYADQISVILPNGRVLISTKAELAGKNINQIDEIKSLVGTDTVTTAFDVQMLAPGQYSFISTKVFRSNSNRVPSATIIVSASATHLAQILTASATFYPEASAHFITSTGSSVGFSIDDRDTLRNLSWHDEHYAPLEQLFKSSEPQGFTDYGTVDRGHVYAYAKWIPSINSGMVLEVPQTTVFKTVDNLVPFTTLLIVIATVLAAALAYLGSRHLTRPLIQLANNASRFANGDWTQRANTKRSDEIGLLAVSFNNMVEQINDLYRSMENRVEQRSQQIRTASEIGQIATSSISREEIAQKTVSLVLERFGYPFAAIALIEESGLNATITAAQSASKIESDYLNSRISVSDNSLMGWVALHNQTRVITDTTEATTLSTPLLQPKSRSVVVMPIAIGSRVMGVFEIHNSMPQGFDNETLSVLQTLCNQVANGFQNMRLLEATQINLEETSLLYRASRLITMTQNEAELTRVLSETLVKTSYVSALFTIHASYLGVSALVDPRNQQTAAATQGISLPLRNLQNQFTTSHVVILDELTNQPEFDNLLSFFVRRGCRSAAIFPIFVSGELARIVVLGSREAFSLNETHLQPYSNLFEVVATTIERLKIHQTLQQRVTEMQIISSVSQAISAETDVFQLYHLLHQQVMQIIGSDIGFLVANYSQKENLIYVPYIYENGEMLSINPFPMGEGLTSHLIKTREPLMMVKDTEKVTQRLGAKIIGKTAKSWLGVPLILGNDVLGAIVLQDTDKEERFTESDLKLFTTLAPQVATAIRNAQLLTEMQQALHAYDQERFLLNSLLENIPEQVFFKDNDGKYIRVSQSFAHQMGLDTPEKAIDQTDHNLLDAEQAHKNQFELESVLASRQAMQSQQKSTRDGQSIWLEVSRIPILNQENYPVGLLGINRDITPLKSAEELAQHRALHLSIAQEIARDTSSTLDMDALLHNATEMVRDRFGFYHASIFILDPLGEYAELRESSGEVGERMKALRHRLAVGSQSLVGQATTTGKPVIINDVTKYPFYFANPMLPETQAELVIPLKVGEKMLGALDVQSTQFNAFNEGDVNILTILADQLAIAILNATLFTESQKGLTEHRLIHQITGATSTLGVDEALTESVRLLQQNRSADRIAIYLVNTSNQLQLHTEAGFDQTHPITRLVELGQTIPGRAAFYKKSILIRDTLNESLGDSTTINTRSALATPIQFANKLIGVLYAENPEPAAFRENDEEIFASLANSLGGIISNGRLVDAIRLQVERQQQILEISNRIRQSLDIKSIMEISASEITKALNARRARISLSLSSSPETETIPTDGSSQEQTL